MEATAFELMKRRMGILLAEPYGTGRGGGYIKARTGAVGPRAAGAILGRRSCAVRRRLHGRLGDDALGIFHAGLASAADPKYTVIPQRERLKARQSQTTEGSGQAVLGST